jgi:prepilin-type N-terminal cleavage/methylation domain-containing protein
MNMQKISQKTGFTLIELLVVIAIIGILSAVVLTSLNGARQKGRDARRISDIKQIQLSLELYYDSTGAYPASICTAGTGPCTSSVLVTNGYIASLPFDPSNTGTKIYSYVPYASTANNTICSGYHIGADLESGSTHNALQTDADATTLTANAGETQIASTQVCNIAGVGADFHGSDAGKCLASDVGTSCYDVRS